MDESNWDNFELRNFNHDLGRWSAPDPYAQFHSPYLAMANNPINNIDPNGGYMIVSSQGRSQRLKFIQSQEMDRMHERGRYSFWFLMNNYRNAIQELYKKHLQQGNPMWTDGKDRGDVAFLKALLRLNNDYVGLGLGCSVMSSGMDFISQNTMVVNKDLVGQLLEFNGTAAKMDDMSRSVAGDDPWATANPHERLEMGIKSGVYAKYSLVGVSVSKRQMGEGKDSETGETDDFVTGYTFYYESNGGDSYHTYINAFPGQNNNSSEVWDSNKDGKLQKSEADNWWLAGKGITISVDNSKISWKGLKIPEGKKVGDVYTIETTDAFAKLPYETAATYGGSAFKVISKTQVQVLDQAYHYKMRPNNSPENIMRNIFTQVGKPKGSGTDFMIHFYNSTITIK